MIKKNDPLYNCCLEVTQASKRLYNAALFRIRNRFTGRNKITLTDHELEIQSELDTLWKSGLYTGQVKSVLSYPVLEKLMRVTSNPDFFCPVLSKQTAQHTVKDAAGDFSNWLKAVKAYRKDPSKFTGKPKMPGYIKPDRRTVCFTNQDCVFRNGVLKFPLTKQVLRMPELPEDAKLAEVKIKPYYENFLVLCTFETAAVQEVPERPFMAGIDFGVDNTAAVATNEGHALLFHGGAMKSANQHFNKERARLVSCITAGHDTVKRVTSHRLEDLSMHRDLFLRDQMHKISSRIVAFCTEHGIGTLILGVNRYWKQESDLGDANNQNFVQMPLAMLRFMITYKAQRVGITVLEQEESYTSKADFLSGDNIPVYGVDDENASFSGKRIRRGLYRSGTGTVLNADINGAANILRKAVPDAFDKTEGFSFLQHPDVYGFHRVNLKGISNAASGGRGIVAA